MEKNEVAGAGRKYVIVLATWLAFGWSRQAFPANQIAPGGTVTPEIAATEYSGNSAQPLRLKLEQVLRVRRVSARTANVSSRENATVLVFGEKDEPLQLKRAEVLSTLPEAVEFARDPAKAIISAQSEDARLPRLRLAEAVGASRAVPAKDAIIATQGEDTQPLRLKLAQEIAALPAVAAMPPAVAAMPPAVATVAKAPVEAVAAPATAGAVATQDDKPVSKFQFAPVDYGFGGDLGYNIQQQTVGADKATSQFLTANLRAVANSFIWQPWFAQVRGGLGLGLTQSTASSNNASNNKSSSNTITGDAALSLLPSSRFPFSAHFSKNNNTQNINLGESSSFQTINYGLSQRYRPLSSISQQYSVSYEHNLWKSNSQTRYENKQDQFKFDSSHDFREQSLRISGDTTRNVRSDTSDSTLTSMLTANHSYRPDPALSLETLGNMIRTDYNVADGETVLTYTQLSSSAFWRPAEKPLTVNGAVRLFGVDTQSSLNNAANQQSRTANANIGANYELSKHLRLNGSGNVNVSETNGSQLVSTNQLVGATYNPDMIDFGPYSYNRSVSTGFSNATGDSGSEQHFTLSPSHGLNRNMDYRGGRLGLNLQQTASSDVGSRATSTLNLSHSASAGWSLSGDQKNTMLRASVSDSRAMIGDEYFFQLLNLQATLNNTVNRYASWDGNLTAQVVRQGTGTTSPTTTTTTTADLSYRHQRAFNVPRLRFTSDLRITGDAFIPVLATPDQQDELSWENRLDYSIGRTQIRLSLRAAQVNKVMQTLLWFSLTRQF